MAIKRKGTPANGKASIAKTTRSQLASKDGFRNSEGFCVLMEAIVEDVLHSDITPSVANAATNASGKWLKMKQLQLAYGAAGVDRARHSLANASKPKRIPHARP